MLVLILSPNKYQNHHQVLQFSINCSLVRLYTINTQYYIIIYFFSQVPSVTLGRGTKGIHIWYISLCLIFTISSLGTDLFILELNVIFMKYLKRSVHVIWSYLIHVKWKCFNSILNYCVYHVKALVVELSSGADQPLLYDFVAQIVS